MSAVALLADLASDGIKLHRDGDELVAEVPPGASLAPYRERIRDAKPALLAALAGVAASGPATLPDPRVLTGTEAQALGLDPQRTWIRVYTGPVEPTQPPADWDGTPPTTCGWPNLCRVLGPCSRSLAGELCRLDRSE